MQQRVTFITLGVQDLARSRAFYEAGLGWTPAQVVPDDIVFYGLGGLGLSLYGRAKLAADAQVEDSPPGFSGITLAHNLPTEPDVDTLIQRAVDAGGRLVKAPHKADWGGYSGYFADPDGHLWEVAVNPFQPLDDQGRLVNL